MIMTHRCPAWPLRGMRAGTLRNFSLQLGQFALTTLYHNARFAVSSVVVVDQRREPRELFLKQKVIGRHGVHARRPSRITGGRSPLLHAQSLENGRVVSLYGIARHAREAAQR